MRAAYPTLAKIERIALWWWFVIGVLGPAMLATGKPLFIGVAGPLMVGLGLVVTLNFDGLAEQLSRRRIYRFEYSAGRWRLQGAFLAICGVVATGALVNAF